MNRETAKPKKPEATLPGRDTRDRNGQKQRGSNVISAGFKPVFSVCLILSTLSLCPRISLAEIALPAVDFGQRHPMHGIPAWVHPLALMSGAGLVIAVVALFLFCLSAGQRGLRLAEKDSILAIAGIGVWRITLLDGHKPRMKANRAMRELLGLSAKRLTEEKTYESWYSRISPEALAAVQALVEEMKSGQKAESIYSWIHPTLGLQYERCGGVAKRLGARGYILRGYQYNVTQDVLREQRREQALQNALAEAQCAKTAKAAFLCNMSHDIRTPMNAILGFTGIALRQSPGPEVRSCLEKINQSAERLLCLVNDVLEISRLASGKASCTPVPVDIRKVTDGALDIAKQLLTNRNLTLHVHRAQPSHPYLLADPHCIRKVLVNLLSNAVKFTNDGGSITFEASERPGTNGEKVLVRYTVSDTGVGMSEEYLDRLYDEFSQENPGARTQYTGAGLGLAITRRYVEMMGGTIEVQSKKGIGSTFVVELPLAPVGAEALQDQAIPTCAADLTGVRVLLAEDNNLNAEIATVLLEEHGMLVTRVDDGQQAVDAFAASPANTFDLFLTDIMMPVLNGYEAARAIRSMANRPDAHTLPIIAMTANAFAEDVQKSLDAGMNAHIAKPIDLNELLRAIERSLNR